MCQYSAEDGTPDDWHLVHLGSRALGGAGLVFTEMTDVSPEARITPGCAGMYRPEHVGAWKRIVDFVHGAVRGEDRHAARPRGPQGLVHAAVGRRTAAARRRAGRSSAPRPSVRPGLAGAAGDGAGRHGPRARGLRARGPQGRRGRLRPARAAHGPRLPAGQLPLAAHQPPRGRVRRDRSRDRLRYPARGASTRCGRPGRRTSRSRCASRPPTGRRAAPDSADRIAIARALHAHGARHRRRLGGRDRARPEAGLRAHVPGAVQRGDPARGGGAHDGGRQHPGRGPGQHHPRRGPRRPRGHGPRPPGRPLPHPARGHGYGVDVPWPPQYLAAKPARRKG